MRAVRQDIHELSDYELALSLDAFAAIVREDMGAPRTAETLTEAAKRLMERK